MRVERGGLSSSVGLELMFGIMGGVLGLKVSYHNCNAT